MSAPIESDEDFAAKVVNFGRDDTDYGDQVADADVDIADLMSDDVDGDDAPAARPVDLDVAGGGDHRARRFDHKVAWGFGGLVAAGVVAALVAAVALYSHDSGPVAAVRGVVGRAPGGSGRQTVIAADRRVWPQVLIGPCRIPRMRRVRARRDRLLRRRCRAAIRVMRSSVCAGAGTGRRSRLILAAPM